MAEKKRFGLEFTGICGFWGPVAAFGATFFAFFFLDNFLAIAAKKRFGLLFVVLVVLFFFFEKKDNKPFRLLPGAVCVFTFAAFAFCLTGFDFDFLKRSFNLEKRLGLGELFGLASERFFDNLFLIEAKRPGDFGAPVFLLLDFFPNIPFVFLATTFLDLDAILPTFLKKRFITILSSVKNKMKKTNTLNCGSSKEKMK